MRSFDELVDEADQVPVDGWDFSWLDGRASEDRPPWGTRAVWRAGWSEDGRRSTCRRGAARCSPRRGTTHRWPCGLAVLDLQTVRLRAEFHDVGAIVHILRKCVWWVPDFSVERYRSTLRRLHRPITDEGPFVAHASRFLIEARRPPGE